MSCRIRLFHIYGIKMWSRGKIETEKDIITWGKPLGWISWILNLLVFALILPGLLFVEAKGYT
jgi:hypothetical protein